MKQNGGIVLLVLAFTAMLGLNGCANLGNGSEIPNGLVTVRGTVAENLAAGLKRSGVHVIAIESDYVPIWGNPRPGIEAFTDSQGVYSLRLYKGVNYNIYFMDSVRYSGAVKDNIIIEPMQTIIAPVELDSLGRINGNLQRETTTTQYDVFLRGSPYSQKIAQSNKFVLTKIPAARYTLGVIALQSDNIRIIVSQQIVEVSAGRAVEVDSLKVGR